MIDSRFYHALGPVKLADLVGGLSLLAPEKFGDLVIETVAALGTSIQADLTFLQSKSFAPKLSGMAVKYCLCSEKLEDLVSESGMTAIATHHPRGDFSIILNALFSRKFHSGREFVSPHALISDSAQVLPGAVIGDGVEVKSGAFIGANATIGPGVVVGENSRIGANSTIQCSLIGNNAHLAAGCRVGGDGFGLAGSKNGHIDVPHIGRVVVEDDVTVGYNTTIDRGMLGDTVIGKGSKIDNQVQIGHNVVLGHNVVIAGHCGISGSVNIGHNVQMGGRVGIADHINIGEGASLAAAAAVMKDVPPGEIWSGYPAKPLRQHMREIAMIAKMVKKR